MDRRDISNIGDEIKDIVQNAVNTRDFHQLNRDIGNTVNSALDEVRSSIGLNQNNWQNRNNQNGNYSNQGFQKKNNSTGDAGNWNNRSRYGGYRTNQNNRSQNWDRPNPYQYQQNVSNIKNQVQRYKNMPATKFTVPVGKVSGIISTVLGGIGIGLFGIAILVLSILSSALNLEVFNYIITGLAPLLAGSILLSARGATLRKRLKRFNQYITLFRSRNYCMIKEISRGSGLSDKFIIKDLKKMISLGMFPEGHIDDQKTCFMLNNESYEQYLKLLENRMTQEAEKLKMAEEEKKVREEKASQDPELKKAIEEGKSYIKQIREANDAIPGEEISRKLYRLENVTSKIFDYVETHPHQLSEIQKFMDYYLPTTSKLLMAYKEFDMQTVQGENITSAKKEIESTLDTINLAFENLLDSLFEDVAMDVSSDISVLQTMLKQEGLTEKDFRISD